MSPNCGYANTALPSNAVCRWSDASLFVANAGVAPFPEVAWPNVEGTTTGVGFTGTIKHDGGPPVELPYEGQYDIQVIGSVTGRQRGVVLETCRDTRVGTSNPWLLCQVITDHTVLEGESGGPVFVGAESPPDGEVNAYGLPWGRVGSAAVLSPYWWNVRPDFEDHCFFELEIDDYEWGQGGGGSGGGGGGSCDPTILC